MRPELITIFPGFGNVRNLEEIKNHPVLLGHSRNIVYTIRDAVSSINNADIFIDRMEQTGTKHEDELKTDPLNVSDLPSVVFRCRLPKVLGFVAIAVVYHTFNWTVFVS